MYNDFAYVYDKLMYDIDYKKWADYINKIFEINQIKPELVLDLGCGTGSICIEMAKMGYEMIGIDISPDMLWCAKQKSEAEGLDILFLNQDMTEFELYGTVDATVSLLDSVNYITSKRALLKMFKLVRNYLNPDGLFIFDINSRYKLSQILADNVFYEVGDECTYIWQNKYDNKKNICEFDLTFFIKQGDLYRRYDEVHYERAYTCDEIEKMLLKAGLGVCGIYDDLTLKPAHSRSERIFFVCRKGK